MSETARPILLVDDNELNLRIYCVALQQAGYRTISTRRSNEALDMIRKHNPCLILLDQDMPEMDGLTLLEQIRAESQVLTIMLTGMDSSKLAVRALRLGAFDYLTKPVDFEKLVDTVRQALSSSSAQQEASQIAHYTLTRLLGRGGMGSVYEALDLTLDRPVALKVLLPELSARPSYELMFLKEARSAAKVSHPNIVTIFEAGRYRGSLYMAMELVKGMTISGRRAANQPFKASEAIETAIQSAQGLTAVHEAGMVHQDIKASNIMLTARGGAKILDFGLARVDLRSLGEGISFAGTVAYASPEQVQSRPLDARSDIYSLGVVLYEMLANDVPFQLKSSELLARDVILGQVKKPLSPELGFPPNLCGLVARMMAPNRQDRPESMETVIRELQGAR